MLKTKQQLVCAGPVWSGRVVPASGPAEVLSGAAAAGAP